MALGLSLLLVSTVGAIVGCRVFVVTAWGASVGRVVFGGDVGVTIKVGSIVGTLAVGNADGTFDEGEEDGGRETGRPVGLEVILSTVG